MRVQDEEADGLPARVAGTPRARAPQVMAEAGVAADRRAVEAISILEASVRRAVARDQEQQAVIASLEARLDDLAGTLHGERERSDRLESALAAMASSRGWRSMLLLRRLIRGARHPLNTAEAWMARRRPPARATVAPTGVPPASDPVPQSEGAVAEAEIPIFPHAVHPRVSIVIPVCGFLKVTLRCLRLLQERTPPGIYEVIVADDASPDASAEVLASVSGLRLVRSTVNRGFVETAAMGADIAGGDHILFLNNDTEVQPGWLEALLDAFDSASDVGAVGAKLVDPGGRLQEAGSIVWADGSAANLGHGDDPDAPQHNMRKEVDYCSAAALLVRGEVLEAVGGLDRRFAPGYYEDADLCFAIRAAGYRVLYEPRAVVVHHRGLSFGDEDRDAFGAARKHAAMEANRQIFAAKWAAQLDQHWPPGTARGYRGGRIDRRPRVLICDHRLPTYDRDSGGLRMSWIVRLLRELGAHVTFLPENLERLEPYAGELQQNGVEVIYRPWSAADLLSERAGLYDIVLLSRRRVADTLIDDMRRAFPMATIVFDTVDLQHVRELRRLALPDADLSAPDDGSIDDLMHSEASVIRRADLVTVVSEEEARAVRDIEPAARTLLLPNVHPPLDADVPGFGDRSDLLFIGGYEHPPNVDAVLWFTTEVLPRIRDRLPVRLFCLGSLPPSSIRDLQSPDIIVTGQIRDVSPWFRRARIMVAPLRYGAGVKGKVGHAMSAGLPVVTTPIGAEGIGIVDGIHALVRGDAEEFADAVVRLYRDPALWDSIASAARLLINSTMSPGLARRQLAAILGRSAAQAP